MGLTLCPGKVDLNRGWARDLQADINEIQAWGAATVITLIESHEFELLSVTELGRKVEEQGMNWEHMPVTDVSIPDQRFYGQWRSRGAELRGLCDRGERILVHCRGGLGRAGIIAAQLLVESGIPPNLAIKRVREARPGAIETNEQENYVLGLTAS